MSTSTTAPPPTAARAGTEAQAPSLLRLVRVELRKSYDTRAGFWLLLAGILITLVVVGLQLFFAEAEDRTYAAYFTTAQFPIGILLPILGILLVTSEWSQRTAMTTFALVPDRSRVLVAKIAAATVLALLGVVVAALVAALATAFTPVFTEQSGDWGLTGTQVGQVIVVQIIFVLVGVGFGMLLLNSPLAIVLNFVLPTAFSILTNTVSALTWVRDWLDLSSTSLPMYDGTLDGQGWLQVATSGALWLLLPLVIGWWRIERSEIA